jgi:2'-5' RNA ligase
MLRLFVALELGEDVRIALADWADAAAPESMRRVPIDNLHVTLAFLGARPEADAEAVAGVLDAVSRPVGKLIVDEPIWLPARRPGVLAVELRAKAPAVAELHADLVAGLTEAIGYAPERRALRPHVTVARVRRGQRLDASRVSPPPALAFAPEALVLYRSDTGPDGVRYAPLARVEQPGGRSSMGWPPV